MPVSGKFLAVVWAAGGNVVPMTGIAGRLAARGHSVRVLGPPELRARFERSGCSYACFERSGTPRDMVEEPFEDNVLGWTRFLTGRGLADDVSAELEHDPPDAVLADAFMPAALCAAERAGVPTAAVVHVLYQASVEGPIAAEWESARSMVDAVRRHLGVAALPTDAPLLPELWCRAQRALACVPEEFDVPLRHRADNVRYVGPVFDDPPSPSRSADDRGGPPVVLVSLSTTDMRHGDLLQRVLDALAPLTVRVVCTLGGVPIRDLSPPPNAEVHDWLDHGAVLAGTSLVVTHAGLSTVMTALAAGVPMVCLPVGRDQPLNAERVAALGVGLSIPCDSAVPAVSAAVEAVLGDPSMAAAAGAMAGVVAGYGNGAAAVAELEQMVPANAASGPGSGRRGPRGRAG